MRAKFGESFLAWAERTPVFVPSFRNWQSSEMTFSFRRVLNNEYKSLYATIIAYVVIELVSGVFAHHRLELDGMWLAIFSVSSVFYVFVRVLKKKTRALDVTSRTAGRARR